MKRTKTTRTGIHYDSNREPIVLSKTLMDALLQQPQPDELIALYVFYYYTAKWQQTNQPKATNFYVCEGLGWYEKKVKRVKSRLKDLGMIESITSRDAQNKITGHYVHVNLIFEKARGVKNHPGGNLPRKYLRDIKKNIYQRKNTADIDTTNFNSITPIKQRNKPYVPICRYLAKIVTSQKNIQINGRKLITWSNDLRLLEEEDGVDKTRMKRVLKWYKSNVGKPYVPDVQSGGSFRKKFINLEAAIERGTSTWDKKKPAKVMEYGEWWFWDESRKAYYNDEGRQLIN